MPSVNILYELHATENKWHMTTSLAQSAPWHEPGISANILNMSQAHTVYIPKNLVVDSVTGNNTSMPMDANVESIRMIQYR